MFTVNITEELKAYLENRGRGCECKHFLIRSHVYTVQIPLVKEH